MCQRPCHHRPVSELDAQALRDAHAEASRAWPDLDVPAEPFEARLRELARETELARLRVADLYLAFACARGVTGAARALESTYFPRLDGMLTRMGARGAVADEVKQRLRASLLVGTAPKIALYRGRGDLWRWLKVAATREAIHLLSRDLKDTRPEELDEMLSPADDPELELLKRTYRAEFKVAFQAALASLEPRLRTVLRYYLVDGLNIEQIGAIYGVHRATVARWIERVREELLTVTRSRLVGQIRVDQGEFESIMRLIQSQLDVSAHRFLAAEDPSAKK
jgi:RNA polymerase sigma-70 factor (ECF subfamily)